MIHPPHPLPPSGPEGPWRRRIASVLAAAALWLATGAVVAASPPPGGAPAAEAPELFVREGCPHCADAERFLEKLRHEQPGLQVTIRDVSRDRQALERLQHLVAKSPGRISGVPALHAHGERLVGFDDVATSGPRYRALLARAPLPPGIAAEPGEMCKLAQETACAPPAQADGGSVEIPWIGKRIAIDDVGLPAFTIAIGLVDGLNPCSMWVLILMISMLASVGDRRRMVAIAGTFVVVEGIAYFAFMAAWLNLFLLIGISRASEIVLGVVAVLAGLVHVKDYFAFGRGISLSIPAAAKPGIYQRMRALLHERSLAMAIAGTVVLAVLVQLVELLCTSGLPALYTRILTLRQLDPWSYYGYLLLYNVMYMLDDVMVLAIGVATLSQKRLQEKEGRMLKLVSGVVMLLLGAYLIVMPA